jgi:DNA-binding transcriptional ArsR family regulator
MTVEIAYAEGMLSVWMYGQLPAKRVGKGSAGWSWRGDPDEPIGEWPRSRRPDYPAGRTPCRRWPPTWSSGSAPGQPRSARLFVHTHRLSRTFNATVDTSGIAGVTLVSTNRLKDESDEVPVAVGELSRIFAALADPTRRDMVTRLAAGDATVNQLAEPYQISLQAVYKHLKVLEDAGVVSRPPGPQPRPVRLEAEVFDLMDKWIERYRRQAEERYRRLDAVLAHLNETETSNDEQEGSAS